MANKTNQTDAPSADTTEVQVRKPLLTAPQAAESLGVPPSMLDRWRGTGEGPAYIKLSGKYVRYSQEDLEAFIAQQRRKNTAA